MTMGTRMENVRAQKSGPRPGVQSRDGEIRTHDPFNPIEVRYLAALRPVSG